MLNRDGALIIVVMGVSGVGKTTIGKSLAERLGAEFLEGDDFHPAANVAKMRRGEPLDDDDRRPWLEMLAAELARRAAAGVSTVLTCSALRRSYRDLLRSGAGIRFVYLAGDPAFIRQRLASRKGHYMPPSLLDSQLATLEEPGADEAIRVDVSLAPDAIVDRICEQLGAAP
jgi:carbohydrate kinase (thermoresistant glucokinase family)